MLTCPRCGQPVTAGASFCARCGAAITQAASPAAVDLALGASPGATDSAGSARWMWPAIGVVVAAVGGGAGFMAWRSKVTSDEAAQQLQQATANSQRQAQEAAAAAAAAKAQADAAEAEREKSEVAQAQQALARAIEEEESLLKKTSTQ